MLGLCRFCFDEPPGAGEVCAHPECPTGGKGGFAVARLAPRVATRPSLVGQRAEVVPPEDVAPVPHIGTSPSLGGRS